MGSASGGGGSGQGASGASIASIGLSAYSDIMKGQGTKATDDFQAANLQNAAAFGRVKATETDAVYRENLNKTLGNIEAIRAAGNVDPTSPTTAVLEDRASMLSDRERMASVVSQRSQAAEQMSSADYLQSAGDFAVGQSYVTASLDVFNGVSKMVFPS